MGKELVNHNANHTLAFGNKNSALYTTQMKLKWEHQLSKEAKQVSKKRLHDP